MDVQWTYSSQMGGFVHVDFVGRGIKGKTSWSALEKYYKIEVKNPFDFLYQLVKVLTLWLQVKFNSVERWAIVDANNTQLTSFIYEEVGESAKGITFVRVGKKWGAVNPLGEEIVAVNFDFIGFISTTDSNDVIEKDYLPGINHIKVKSGKRYGIYSLRGELLLNPVYKELWSVNADAKILLEKSRPIEVVNTNDFRKLPLDPMFSLLPKKLCLIGSEYIVTDKTKGMTKKNFHLFVERDNGFDKFDIVGRRNPKTSVSYKTGFVFVEGENHNYYVISPNSKVYGFEGYPILDKGYIEVKDGLTTKILNLGNDILYNSIEEALN